ncbi:hypothetical protein DFH06DRAFT_219263 [Mycena polygramma]|nr:hypothetical protein DFH06DRAFT_219263 [Mycena polygramma]
MFWCIELALFACYLSDTCPPPSNLLIHSMHLSPTHLSQDLLHLLFSFSFIGFGLSVRSQTQPTRGTMPTEYLPPRRLAPLPTIASTVTGFSLYCVNCSELLSELTSRLEAHNNNNITKAISGI